MTLRPRRVQVAGLFLLCLLFVLGGIWMVREGEPMGYFCGGFFALGLPVFALQFHPQAAYLHLAPDGFTFCGLFRPHTVRWADVREFGVISVWSNRMVAWNFTPDYPASRKARGVARLVAGYEAALPSTYGMKPQELADLMEGLRQKYRGSEMNINPG